MGLQFRIAVLSDLHAAPKLVKHKPGEVKLYSDQPHAGSTDNPILALKALIDAEKLRADVIACPGDMTNKANAQSLAYVWTSLHDVRTSMQASGVVATVGNHDVDSRTHDSDSFPRESLMRLTPRFPTGDTNTSDQYWAHGFCFQEFGDARFLVLNTCWLHEARDELNRGVVTSYTLEQVKERLNSLPKKPLNFVICHHHPHPHSELGLGFDDVIQNGQRLLDLLSDDAYWMVIHGHKHHPKIEYAQGQYRQPVVLACGSFSGRLEGDNALVSKNYFHLVEIKDSAGRIAGTIRSWNWVPGLGWKQYSDSLPAFPSKIGFGASLKIEDLAQSVAQQVTNKVANNWSGLVNALPELEFLMPRQLNALITLLKKQYKIETVYDDFGYPAQLGPTGA
jgi:3',5'-cyclic AMP phosphodiesterase CpdA